MLFVFFCSNIGLPAISLPPNRTILTYSTMVMLLKRYAASVCKVFCPRAFQLDSEAAALNVIQEEFP